MPALHAERSRAVKKPLSRSLRLYQRLAVAFVALTFLLLLTVLYLSVSRATITIVARPKVVSVTAAADIVPTPSTEGELAGVVRETQITKSQVFTLPQEGARVVEGKSEGYVVLKNETTSAQPLVATTRVLSEGGVLFRLVSPVTVPASGEVRALVRADLLGKTGDIGPSKFTIPGLRPQLQTAIYAMSDAAMVGGVQYVRSLTETDVKDATAALVLEAEKEAHAALEEGIDRALFTGAAYSSQVISATSDVPVGTEAGTFGLTVTMAVSAVFYNQEVVNTYAEALLRERVPEGFVLSQTNFESAQVSVEASDRTKGTARLSVYLDGASVLSRDAAALQKDRFMGRAPHEVLTLLRASEAVEEAHVSFSPFWLKRVPTLEDHIEILIEEPKE